MDSQKELRGCEGFKEPQELRLFDGEEITINRCPVKEISVDTKLYFEGYHFYKRGFLPSGKAWDEQPSKLIDVFMFLDSTFADIEQKEREKIEAMRKKK